MISTSFTEVVDAEGDEDPFSSTNPPLASFKVALNVHEDAHSADVALLVTNDFEAGRLHLAKQDLFPFPEDAILHTLTLQNGPDGALQILLTLTAVSSPTVGLT